MSSASASDVPEKSEVKEKELEEDLKSLTEMGFDYNQSYHCIFNLRLTAPESVDLLQD